MGVAVSPREFFPKIKRAATPVGRPKIKFISQGGHCPVRDIPGSVTEAVHSGLWTPDYFPFSFRIASSFSLRTGAKVKNPFNVSQP